VRAKQLMTQIAAKFEGMTAVTQIADPVSYQLSSIKGALLIPSCGTDVLSTVRPLKIGKVFAAPPGISPRCLAQETTL